MLKTSNFEAIKIALKQDKNGYVLTLCVHPDDLSEDIMRDFVGSRYQVVMVRLNEDETAMQERPKKKETLLDAAGGSGAKTPGIIASAGILCRDPMFWDWLHEQGELLEKNESNAVEALHRMVGIDSRLQLTDPKFQLSYDIVMKEFKEWEQSHPPF